MKKLLIYMLNIPSYWISKIVPADRNLWVFGAWLGETYSDNSKYLFEYMLNLKDDNNIKIVWLTKNKSVYNRLKQLGYPVEYTYSFKGYYLSARAIVHIICNHSKDTNLFIHKKNVVNLWHGAPLKKLGNDKGNIYKLRDSKVRKALKSILFPFLNNVDKRSIFIASSNKEAKNLSTAFNIPLEKIKVTGLPRNDVFLNVELQNKSFFSEDKRKKIIYMPTHRLNGDKNAFNVLYKNLDFINNKMKNMDCVLYVKLHFHHMNEIENIENEFSNILFIKDKDISYDIYSVLPGFDILITDYSSVYFDFLLSDKPIIFFPYDMDSYVEQEKGFYYDYDKFTPGPKCMNWESVVNEIFTFIEGNDSYKLMRHEICSEVHAYKDGAYCERVYNFINKNFG